MISHPMGTAAHVTHVRAKNLRGPKVLPVPITCLYSLTDGVVPPQEATIDGNPALHENVRVAGSHLGLGFNPFVLWIVADRLAQPEGRWQPYSPTGVSGRLYRLFSPGAAEPAAAEPAPSPSPAPAHAQRQGTPGNSRARTARTPPDRASARGRTSARR